jgi:hypothetical protein
MDQVTLTRATVQQALHVATAAAPYPVALIATLRAALEQQEPSDPGSVPVKRSRMEALSKALGHPTQLAVAEGDTAEDALVELAASRLEQPKPPPEAQTEAERLAYCAGWWAAMEQKREQPAQEPVALFDARLRAWRG